MGAIAGSDSHQMEHGVEGGILGAFVPSLTRANVFDAMYNRFVYGTTGSHILVSLKINDAVMGSEITVAKNSSVSIEVDVLGTNDLASVEVVKDNDVFYSAEVSGNRCKFTIQDSDIANSGAYYYLRVNQKDEHMAWSSPIWVDIAN